MPELLAVDTVKKYSKTSNPFGDIRSDRHRHVAGYAVGNAPQGSRRMEVVGVLLGKQQRPFISMDREKTTSTWCAIS